MNAVLRRSRFLGRSPLTIIEFVLAISTIVGGLYVLSPFLAISTTLNGASPLVATLANQVGIGIFGSIFTLTGLGSLYGIFKRNYRIRAVSMFIQFMCRFYAVIVGWLIQGFLPLSWLTTLTLAVICVILWLWLKGLVFQWVVDD